jgi:hypothetical protein
MWQIDSMAYTGVVVYMVVDGPINPATAMYRTSLEDPTQYTLKQLLDMHGICAPQLSFYLPSNRGLKPPFYKIHQVDWAKYKLELAAGAKAALKGGHVCKRHHARSEPGTHMVCSQPMLLLQGLRTKSKLTKPRRRSSNSSNSSSHCHHPRSRPLLDASAVLLGLLGSQQHMLSVEGRQQAAHHPPPLQQQLTRPGMSTSRHHSGSRCRQQHHGATAALQVGLIQLWRGGGT